MAPHINGLPGLFVAATLAVALIAAPAIEVHAQGKAPAPAAPAAPDASNASKPNAPTAEPSAGTPDISEEKLTAAAAAMQNVVSVRQDYQAKIAAAAPHEKDRITGEANAATVKAVTDQGLSVQEYNQILHVAQNNPEVRQKILERMKPAAK